MRASLKARSKGWHVQRFKSGDKDPVRFAVTLAEEAGRSMVHGAARLLVELVGNDLARIETEIGGRCIQCR